MAVQFLGSRRGVRASALPPTFRSARATNPILLKGPPAAQYSMFIAKILGLAKLNDRTNNSRAVAALNHPNYVWTVFDVGPNYRVEDLMEVRLRHRIEDKAGGPWQKSYSA